MNYHTTYAVDVAKSVFETAVSQHPGQVRECHGLSRERLVRFFARHTPGTALLDARGSSHHWARTLRGLGGTASSCSPLAASDPTSPATGPIAPMPRRSSSPDAAGRSDPSEQPGRWVTLQSRDMANTFMSMWGYLGTSLASRSGDATRRGDPGGSPSSSPGDPQPALAESQ
jgi:hypothetical protein